MTATYPNLHFVVFKQTACHLAAEANVEQVFSRAGQLSEVNLDPDSLTNMVSIMVNKLAYKPSVKDIMDKDYEMFRGRQTKKLFQQSDSPELRDPLTCVPKKPVIRDQKKWLVMPKNTQN